MIPLAAAGKGITLNGPLATVLASIAAALITGFGAASLRHSWDVRADATNWNRSRDQRIRAQLLDAFSNYLAVRPDLRTFRTITANPEDTLAIVSTIQLAAASLLILLADANDRHVIETDLKAIEAWVETSLKEPSIANWTAVPAAKEILNLARNLAVEATGTPRRRSAIRKLRDPGPPK